MPTLDERIADLGQRRLEGLMRRAQLDEALTSLAAQKSELEKTLYALDGALELAHALTTEAGDGV